MTYVLRQGSQVTGITSEQNRRRFMASARNHGAREQQQGRSPIPRLWWPPACLLEQVGGMIWAHSMIGGGESEPRHHFYVCVASSEALREHLLLRDYLRALLRQRSFMDE
jgi:GrpB-like predicted nucleotidyltransferase (UPF0157 family)